MYSPSWCSKPILLSFFCRTQKKIVSVFFVHAMNVNSNQHSKYLTLCSAKVSHFWIWKDMRVSTWWLWVNNTFKSALQTSNDQVWHIRHHQTGERSIVSLDVLLPSAPLFQFFYYSLIKFKRQNCVVGCGERHGPPGSCLFLWEEGSQKLI